ncbi:MAG: competence protein F [Patescibacteria group bacterium]|nr:MAG: competence protein F [Patescibacteria group bacterium]
MDIWSIFFPKKCIGCGIFGAYLCSNCFSRIEFTVSSVCAVCSKPSLDGRTHPFCKGRYDIDGVIAGVVYKGIIKRLLYQFKFKPYLFDLRATIADLFYESLIQHEVFMQIEKDNAIFSPIPLHQRKLQIRGYNQAELLARDLAERFLLPVKTLLKRKKETTSQVGKTRKERRINLQGAFEINCEIDEKNIFLVDDVVTSGATLNEAAKTLKKAGAEKVWGLAFAHGE